MNLYELATLDPEAPICPSGKRPLRNQDTARKHLRTAAWTKRNLGRTGRKADKVERDVYECKACGWWHLTGQAPNTGRPRRGGGR